MKLITKEQYNEITKRLWDFRIKRAIQPSSGNKVEKIFVQNASGLWKLRAVKTIQEVQAVTGNAIKPVIFYYTIEHSII